VRVTNKLFYGDNLEVMRERIASESVDLVYLDPPFNSNRNYNVIFAQHDVVAPDSDSAQIQAFGDTWHWTPVTQEQFESYTEGGLPSRVADALSAFRTLLGENDAMAYLVNMAPRMVELHRVLKSTGSLYLHCDSTMSHYLKVLLDAIFGAQSFRNEIIWQRHNARSVRQSIWPRLHDVILFYAKSSTYQFEATKTKSSRERDPHDLVTGTDGKRYRTKDLTGQGVRNGETGQPWRGIDVTPKGRHWRTGHVALEALDAAGRLYWQKSGIPREIAAEPYDPNEREAVVGDLWTDIDSINAGAAERLGYPTQKPVALMKRIVKASSRPGDVVLDPFCGCGTTIDAAQQLGRQWLGIDVTYIAVDLIEKRLKATFGADIDGTYEVLGIPRDIRAAQALFDQSPFDFERWAVSLINAQPNERQVGDKGIDGVARFGLPNRKNGRILVSVKGGKNINPAFARDLLGTVNTQKAEMGVLITMAQPTKGVLDAVNHAGTYTWPINGETFPKIQVITTSDLLAGKRPHMPSVFLPYMLAQRVAIHPNQMDLGI
jgi:DNA modification methylase